MNDISAKLLAHYDAHARVLPWRDKPGVAADPYRIWLSEIMLQQTTVAAVAPYYTRFLARWPTVEALAAADEAELMAAWAGLGYYARARNLIACARAVVAEHGGRFPRSEAALRALPGIGAYTAAAIAAIAFGEAATVIDANVERVVARLFAIATPLPAGKAEIRAAAETLTPPNRPGDFAQAMMDLGATLCTPRDPACFACPLNGDCMAFRSGAPAAFPARPRKRARPQRYGHVWFATWHGKLWLVRRPASGLLGGMRALPSSDWREPPAEPDPTPPSAAAWRALPEPVAHVFTHFALSLTVHVAETDCMGAGEGEWWPLETWEAAGLPTVFAKAAMAAMQFVERVR